MNANELADALVNTEYTPLKAECATMLRQLQAENEALKATIHNAKLFIKSTCPDGFVDEVFREQPCDIAETCTNSDSWNCKYCNKTETCKALKDIRNFGIPKKPAELTDLMVLEWLKQY